MGVRQDCGQRDYLAEVYDFAVLESAYESSYLYLGDLPESAEEWLINLQNHLIWRSYQPGEDPDMDIVVLNAIGIILKRHSLRIEDAGLEIKTFVDVLTLA